MKLEKCNFYAHILNEYEKEEEEEKTKNKFATFHRVLLRKKGEYLFSISLTHQMIKWF